MALDYRKVISSYSKNCQLKFLSRILGSPYRERFSEIILDLQEKGIVSVVD